MEVFQLLYSAVSTAAWLVCPSKLMRKQVLLVVQYPVSVIGIVIFSSYTVGTGSFPVLKGRGMALTTHPI